MNTKTESFRFLILGAFLILTLNLLLSISLFISKVLAVYVFNNISTIDYVYAILVIGIIFYEVLFLRKSGWAPKLVFKKVVIFLLFLYILNFISTYIEGRILAIEVAEKFQREEMISYHVTSQYPSFIFSVHNMLLLVFSLFKLWK